MCMCMHMCVCVCVQCTRTHTHTKYVLVQVQGACGCCGPQCYAISSHVFTDHTYTMYDTTLHYCITVLHKYTHLRALGLGLPLLSLSLLLLVVSPDAGALLLSWLLEGRPFPKGTHALRRRPPPSLLLSLLSMARSLVPSPGVLPGTFKPPPSVGSSLV